MLYFPVTRVRLLQAHSSIIPIHISASSISYTDAKRTVPHPLFSNFELRIQTDGEITPKEALVTCCRNLVSELEVFSREFTKEFELRKMVSGDVAATEK